jgi:signal transduction histidine kinase
MTDHSKTEMPVRSSTSAIDLFGDRANILLVDDRPDKLMALEAILANPVQNLILARSGIEALRILLQQNFALIVLDVSMPGLDGFETASLIRQRRNSELTPIIFISAVNYDDIHLSRGYSLGAVDYILAPIVPEILRAKVSFFVELHKKTEQLKRQAAIEAQLIRERAARAEAEAANRAKDRFLAVLSHELRTPLTPILFASSILSQDSTVPEHIRNQFKSIAHNAKLEARLIDDLLDVTSISQGRLNLEFEISNVHELLRSAAEIYSEELLAKNMTMRFELEAAHYYVRADAARLRQVFWNLTKNAIKFAPPNSRITARSVNAATNLWRLEFTDTGIGIASDVLPKIFDAFVQDDCHGTSGLGLGLTISKAIVELHEGQISAFSRGVGQGATFVVELPYAMPNSFQPSDAKTDSAAPPGDAKRSVGARILLVDDHAETVCLMRLLLARNGYKVTSASSVGAALRSSEEQHFDLLICDIELPDGSGHDLIWQLRKNGHAFPSIALTAYGIETDVENSGVAGFQVHLTKPALPQLLVKKIGELLTDRCRGDS